MGFSGYEYISTVTKFIAVLLFQTYSKKHSCWIKLKELIYSSTLGKNVNRPYCSYFHSNGSKPLYINSFHHTALYLKTDAMDLAHESV